MKLTKLTPKKALNKAFLKQPPLRSQIDLFKAELISLLDGINAQESEEHNKNLVSTFLKNIHYSNNFINTKGRNDLVIHNNSTAKSTVGVIIEAKKPNNKAEMITTENLNAKAFEELILYYLRERITAKNLEVKYLIATNIYEWFIFDATVFDRLFAQNKTLVKQFIEFEEGRLSDIKTDFFYKQIAEPFIASIETEIEFAHFNLQDYQKPLRNESKADDNTLIALYKLLSPEHLLKLPFSNDSNTLDKRFYTELLHIIGLSEIKEGNKKVIDRNKEGERNTGTILEDTIIQLDSLDKLSRLEKPNQFGITSQERLFNVALELSITWVNRILFLKLLEAQLISYHSGDKSYSFLNLDKIKNYDDLNSLFFQVLARKHSERNEDVKKIFEKIPYLNSSLFEPTEIEQVTLLISNLKDDKTIPIFTQTVLKNQQGKKQVGSLNALEYLFEFLNSYDFSGEGTEEIEEDNKTLINASVLGLIFEKINGYKDGSYFTPGFITMYMCRETIRKAVVQKFNETKNWNCATINDLYDKIENRTEANNIVNSIKICDPAVGSGHFLVSALNEMIAVKNDLKILQDREGKRLKEYEVEVVNDELIITDEDGELFEYKPSNKETQRIQESLFHEKQTIIENCLFGVDINTNSVKICRLRLWIELLKNSYYKNSNELETLPNIDINIKCGNSLISRFAIDADLRQALKKSKYSIDSYRIAVDTYRNAQNKEQKREMEKLISLIKTDFVSELSFRNKEAKDIVKYRGLVVKIASDINNRIAFGEKVLPKLYKELEIATAKKEKAEATISEIENNKIYENAFEWRFEFPEVLNAEGDFVGFDAIIGNPPYVFTREAEFDSLYKNYVADFLDTRSIKAISKGLNIQTGKINLFGLFMIRAYDLMKKSAVFSFIVPNNILRATTYEAVRLFLLDNCKISEIVDLGSNVFAEATVSTVIFSYEKIECSGKTQIIKEITDFEKGHFTKSFISQNIFRKNVSFTFNILLNDIEISLIEKLQNDSKPLSDYFKYISPGIDGDKEKYVSSTQINSNYKPLLFGKNFGRYHINFDNNFVNYDRNLLNRAREEEIYLSEKIIVQRISGGSSPLTCTIDRDKFYTFNSVNNLVLKENIFISLEYFLALLNSNVLNWYYSVMFSNKSTLTVNISKTFLSELPIKENLLEHDELKKLVNSLLEIGKENINEIQILEEKINNIVYKIYGLSNDEITIIENSVNC